MDGQDSNYSFNHGHEGPSSDPAIVALRERQKKNFLATLLLSIGTPMLLGGDEFSRTQKGNNNAYCQDNAISWYDWGLAEKNRQLVRFVKEVIALRMSHPAFRRPEFFTGKDANFNSLPDIAWFAPDGNAVDWDNPIAAVSARLDGSKADIIADRDDNDFFIMLNASEMDIDFVVSSPQPGWTWHRSIDTSLPSPLEIATRGEEPMIDYHLPYRLKAKSLGLLLARR